MFCPERPLGGALAAHSRRPPAGGGGRLSPRLQTLHHRGTCRQPRAARDPPGNPGERHQDHQRAANRDERQPARSPQQLQPSGFRIPGEINQVKVIN